MVELKPCPFCGGRARVIRLGHKNGTAFDDWGVECIKCGAMPKVITMYQFHDTETIERECARFWNRRAEPAPVTAGEKLNGGKTNE